MTPAQALALVLVAAVALAWTRLLLRQRRAPVAGGRLSALLLLQPLCAGLLYLALLPPSLPTEAGTLTVLAAGADREMAAGRIAGGTVLALPEAPPLAGVERVPDLATALRRNPGTRRVQVIGHGLDPRDLHAARGVALTFDPPPPPPGLSHLEHPTRVAPGAAFPVSGRAAPPGGGRALLLDPAGQLVDAAELDEAGGFRLRGHVRAAGPASFQLRLEDGDGREIESVRVPLEVAEDPPPRVLLLSGAPNPEFRHLRRWGEDAGLDLHVEVAVGRGVGLGDGPAPASAEGFAGFDLVILDERTLANLGAARRAALAQALGAGTGVLVRATAALPATVRAWLAELGIALTGEGSEDVAFPAPRDAGALRARMGPGSEGAPFDPVLAQEAPPELSRRALRPGPGDALALPAGGADAPFAWWRAHGRGRIGVWTLTDSYRLALAGRGDLHAELWSAAAAVLARPLETAPPRIDPDVRAGMRMAICGLDASQVEVIGPDGSSATALVDPAAGDGCAGYWPEAGGWHLLQAGEAAWPFHVRGPDEAPGLAAAALRDATMRLVGGAAPADAGGQQAGPPRRGPSWSWFTGWLVAAGLLWWLERRRPKSG